MTRTNHPIEQEELMAYLDGELTTERAVTAAAHLEHCQECQRLVDDFKALSQKMMEWEVEASDSEIRTDIATALERREKQPQKAAVSDRRDRGAVLRGRWLVWAGGLAVVVLLAVVVSIRAGRPKSVTDRFEIDGSSIWQSSKTSSPPIERGRNSQGLTTNGNLTNGATSASSAASYSYDSLGNLDSSTSMENDFVSPLRMSPTRQATPRPDVATAGKPQQDVEIRDGNDSESDALAPDNGPLIVRTAGLTVMVKEFDKARVALDEILKRHHGYMGELNVSIPSDAGRTVTATLRVPADQLDATLAELKTLGRVEGESQGGEEVTQQYVDLQARLANAKHMEQRLTDILRQRTGKLSDVLAVEVQIGRVRGEIERMQAEKKELTKQVQFATLNATVKEDYKAPLQMAPPSTSNRFRNAAIDGYKSVVEGFVDVLLFLLSAGPSLLVWGGILFFPARWAWRKLKKNFVKKNVQEAS